MIILFLLSIQILPSNSTDACAYLIGAGGGECGYVIADIALTRVDMSYTGKEVTKIFTGLVVSGITQYLLRDHFENEDEHTWVSVGRGHYLVVRTSVSILKGLIRKKEKRATLEKWEEEIEFYQRR